MLGCFNGVHVAPINDKFTKQNKSKKVAFGPRAHAAVNVLCARGVCAILPSSISVARCELRALAPNATNGLNYLNNYKMNKIPLCSEIKHKSPQVALLPLL